MKETINHILQGFLIGTVLAMILFLLAVYSIEAHACKTSYKWVCDSKGDCEWVVVCE